MIGPGVTIGEGTIVRDSIIMKDVSVGEGCVIDKAIIAESVEVGSHVTLGIGADVPNQRKP